VTLRQARLVSDERNEISRFSNLYEFQQVMKATGLTEAIAAELLAGSLGMVSSSATAEITHWCGHTLFRLRHIRKRSVDNREHLVRLDRAVAAIWHRCQNPWPVVLDRLCDSSLVSWQSVKSAPLLMRTFVRLKDLYDVLTEADAPSWRFNVLPLTFKDMKVVFAQSPESIIFLRANNCLPKEVFFADIELMKSKYILASEIIHRRVAEAEEFRWRCVTHSLSKLGLQPLSETGPRRLWSRKEVEAKIEGRVIPLIK
jgi:hypothetical protein